MKSSLVIILLLFSFHDVIANDQQPIKSDFTLIIEFWPSFFNSSILTISSNSGNQINLKLEEIRYEANYNTLPDKETINSYKLVSKNNLLLDKEMKGYIEQDSVFISTLEEVTLSDSKKMNSLIKHNLENQESLLIPKDIVISDGTRLYFKYTSNLKTNYFKFDDMGSAKKEAKLMKLIFDLALNNFNEIQALEYIERLSVSFDFGLQSRQINNDPLEYRIFGVAYWEDFRMVKKFIKKLPKRKPVILDFTNYYGTDVFFDELEEFLQNKSRTIYLLVNNYWKKRIEQYDYEWEGVKIFIDRKNLLNDLN